MRHDVDIKADSSSPVKALDKAQAAGDELLSVVRLHDGTEHSIAHLAPGKTITCACKEMERDLVIRVIYTNHCYTENFDPKKHNEEEILIKEAKDRHRVFCPIRHGLSHKLPEILADLPNRKVHQTAQGRNYVFVVPLEVEGQMYEVYFMLQRASKDDEADLKLTVESAYPNGGSNVRKRPNTIRFFVLAYKVMMNQRVRFAAR